MGVKIIVFYSTPKLLYTDKKEIKMFLIYKEIQMGAVAESDMTYGLLMYYVLNICIFPHILGSLSSYMTLKVATAPFLNFLI